MKDELTKEQADVIANALKKALSEGPWDESNFLRLVGKKLHKINEDFVKQVEFEQRRQSETSLPKEINRKLEIADGDEIIQVFISLYAADGNNIQAWEPIIANLPRQLISRPIYSTEEDVQTMIKSKEKQRNEAYVVASIRRSSILPPAPDKIPQDKFGKTLYMLRERAVSMDNIHRFVHASGTYHFIKGHLEKVS